jgi:hypothetical protein
VQESQGHESGKSSKYIADLYDFRWRRQGIPSGVMGAADSIAIMREKDVKLRMFLASSNLGTLICWCDELMNPRGIFLAMADQALEDLGGKRSPEGVERGP